MRAGVGEPGLQEADAAVVLDAVEADGLRRQPELAEDAGAGNRPWKAMLWIVMTDGAPHAVEAQVGRARAPACQSWAWTRSGRNSGTSARGDVGGGAAERAEAAPVVGLVGAVGSP